MNLLMDEQLAASRKGSLSKGLSDLQKSIDLIEKARELILVGKVQYIDFNRHALMCYHEAPTSAAITLVKVQASVTKAFEDVNNDLQDVSNKLGSYTKSLGKVKQRL